MKKKINMFIVIAALLAVSGLGTVGSAHAQQKNSFQPSNMNFSNGGWNWWGWWQWWLHHHHHHHGPPGESDHPGHRHDGDDNGNGKGEENNHDE